MQRDFQCRCCGEWNATDVNQSADLLQQYVEDSQVCCQPKLLTVRFDPRWEQFEVRAERES